MWKTQKKKKFNTFIRNKMGKISKGRAWFWLSIHWEKLIKFGRFLEAKNAIISTFFDQINTNQNNKVKINSHQITDKRLKDEAESEDSQEISDSVSEDNDDVNKSQFTLKLVLYWIWIFLLV